MINRLIDINPTIIVTNKPANTSVASVAEYAQCFINGLGETQLNRFKNMLINGIECGQCVASNYGIDYTEFISEVKKILKVGE